MAGLKLKLNVVMSGDGEKYVAALDVGTTKLKCIIFDQNMNVRGEEAALVSFLEFS